jgi:ABC-type sugar transport system substrate-binding protein
MTLRVSLSHWPPRNPRPAPMSGDGIQKENTMQHSRAAGRGRRLLAGVFTTAALTVLAACGGGSTGGAPSDAKVDEAGLQAARDAVAEFSKQPTAIPNDEPITKPIPEGKDIVFLSCGTSTCNLEADIIKEATDALGWTLTSIPNDGTPEKTKAGWSQILRTKPDGVLYTATPVAAFKNELDQAAAAGIEVAACCTTDAPDDKLDFVIGTPAQSERPGALMANWVIDQSGGKGSAVFVNLSAFEIIQSIKKGFDGAMAENCPEACKAQELDIPITALGKDVPDRIVSFLRANPGTKYVVLSVDGALGAGLPSALKAAGLNDVTIIGEGPDENTLQYISSGQQEATVTFPYYEEMFSMVDALARKFADVPLEESIEVPDWIVTADTLPTDDSIFPVVADVKEQYFKLWGIN